MFLKIFKFKFKKCNFFLKKLLKKIKLLLLLLLFLKFTDVIKYTWARTQK